MNKPEEIFYKISRSHRFQKEIREFRKHFGIPDNGCTTDENVRKWVAQRDKPIDKFYKEKRISAKDSKPVNLLLYYAAQGVILAHYGLPTTSGFLDMLDLYILRNEIRSQRKLSEHFCDIEPGDPIELERMVMPYLRLRIYGGASGKDVGDFINEHWRIIKGIVETTKGKKIPRIRKTNNKERDAILLELHGKRPEELGFKKGIKGLYREAMISKYMREKYGIEVSPEAVKKAVSRERKLRNL